MQPDLFESSQIVGSPALKDGVPLLRLDEKKIRKGKPLGLPYQGSKKKVAKKIVEIIKQNFGTDKIVYDVFGGGGAITSECIINGLPPVQAMAAFIPAIVP